jgi:hypothetical protein
MKLRLDASRDTTVPIRQRETMFGCRTIAMHLSVALARGAREKGRVLVALANKSGSALISANTQARSRYCAEPPTSSGTCSCAFVFTLAERERCWQFVCDCRVKVGERCDYDRRSASLIRDTAD